MAAELYLGIESSCDETAAAVVDLQGPRVLSNVISSQHATHAKYGGVVPELASREHLRNLGPVLQNALGQAGVQASQLKGIAVTHGPGLAGSLAMGLSAAKALALAWELPFIGVNHLEGHLSAAFLENAELSYPYVGLVVSGGHTSLYAVEGLGLQRRLAGTRDDAAGEAFDKVAKLLDLGFPGGPALDKLAGQHAGPRGMEFPSALMKDKSLDARLTGLGGTGNSGRVLGRAG
jgi:N6-L-threonylcarbamoyladenine synthase